MGDLVIAVPFMRAAVEKFEVTLLAKPVAVEMRTRLWPMVEVIPFTAPWTAFRFGAKYGFWHWPWTKMLRLRRELRAREFDFGVSARWDPREHFLLKTVGACERLGFPRLGSNRYLTCPLDRPAPLAHRNEYWRAAGSKLGLTLPSAVESSIVPRRTSSIILIHTGARLPLRVWPLENFQEIVQRLRRENYTVQIVCDDDQLNWWRNHGEEVLCPGTVSELLDCLDKAAIFIGNDSGPGHLAANCGLPTFTLFGPQLHEWFAPMHPTAEWIEGKACPYKPCSDYCRYPAPFCLWNITKDEVWPRIQTFIKRHLQACQSSRL